MKSILAIISFSFIANIGFLTGQAKISMNVEHETLGNDTFYFQKTQYNSLNLGFSDGVTSFFIGRNSGNVNYGGFNIALGNNTMPSSVDGAFNTVLGHDALTSLTSGFGNIAVGNFSLNANMQGENNLALGTYALRKNVDADNNLAIGNSALANNISGTGNLAIGTGSLLSNKGSNKNMAIGFNALLNGYDGTSNTDKNNIGIGYEAMLGSINAENNTGYDNVAVGNLALKDYTTGYQNVAIGDASMQANATGAKNSAVGANALMSNVGGFNNVAIGFEALKMNTDGGANTAVGVSSMVTNTSGSFNTSLGTSAMTFNTEGSYNTAIGNSALNNNTTGEHNVAIGVGSLKNSTDKSFLVAVGDSALYNNGFGGTEVFHGTRNTAVGSKSLLSNTIGNGNTALGHHSLKNNTDGYSNTSVGTISMLNNSSGESNAALGLAALLENISGDFNVGSGAFALFLNETGDSNVGIGYSALSRNKIGNDNTVIGDRAGFYTTGSGNVLIGNQAGFNELGSNKLYINNDNSGPDGSLIYGEFDNKILVINGADNNGTTAALQVQSSGQTMLIDANEIDVKNNANLSLNGNTTGSVFIGKSGNTTTDHTIQGKSLIIANPTSPVLRLERTGGGYDFEMLMDGTPDLVFRGGNTGTLNNTHDIFTFENDGDLWVKKDATLGGNLSVCGTIGASIATVNVITCSSDSRFKKNIEPLQNSLESLLSVRGVHYDWRVEEFAEKNFSTEKQIGFIAQEIEEVFPSMVLTDKEGYKSVDYSRLTPVLVEAMKEQQQMISAQTKQIKELQDQLSNSNIDQNEMKAELSEIKDMLKKAGL